MSQRRQLLWAALVAGAAALAGCAQADEETVRAEKLDAGEETRGRRPERKSRAAEEEVRAAIEMLARAAETGNGEAVISRIDLSRYSGAMQWLLQTGVRYLAEHKRFEAKVKKAYGSQAAVALGTDSRMQPLGQLLLKNIPKDQEGLEVEMTEARVTGPDLKEPLILRKKNGTWKVSYSEEFYQAADVVATEGVTANTAGAALMEGMIETMREMEARIGKLSPAEFGDQYSEVAWANPKVKQFIQHLESTMSEEDRDKLRDMAP